MLNKKIALEKCLEMWLVLAETGCDKATYFKEKGVIDVEHLCYACQFKKESTGRVESSGKD